MTEDTVRDWLWMGVLIALGLTVAGFLIAFIVFPIVAGLLNPGGWLGGVAGFLIVGVIAFMCGAPLSLAVGIGFIGALIGIAAGGDYYSR